MRGEGFSTEFITRGGMLVITSRLNIFKGLGPVLQIAECYTVDLPREVAKALIVRIDLTWPTTWFAPRLTGRSSCSFRDAYS